MYVYKNTEPGLYTVGYYEPGGAWVPESDHNNKEEAAARVSYLNGNPRSIRRRPSNYTVGYYEPGGAWVNYNQ